METRDTETPRIQPRETWLTRDDGASLFVRRWKGEGRVRAAVQLVHGMAEHGGRYGRLASVLSAGGIEVWAADQRGHGKTADPARNGPEKGGLLGHTADRAGFFKVVEDVNAIFSEMRREHGEALPLFLLGHSWGSFIAQAYIETYGERLSGCMLSGTRGPGGLKITLGARLTGFVRIVKGSRKSSRFVHAMVDGAYARPFRPNRTPFDWLSRDEAEVDLYVRDPLCGELCSTGFYHDMLAACRSIHGKEAVGKIPRELPVYILSGSADPVGDMGASPTALVTAYKERGLQDLEFVLYPGARHEPFNETNRDEVSANLLSWLEKHL